MYTTPVLFIVFNRLDTAIQVLSAIRKVKPVHLYIAADGPRMNKEGESAKCQLVRKTIIEGIDWECDVKTLFRKTNLGCGQAVSSAIRWFFDQVEEGIILEDDLIPHPDFFPFCSELLEKYRYDQRISLISGDNFQNGIKRGEGSYYFSAYTHIWGWASWRRVWDNYEYDLGSLDLDKLKIRINHAFKMRSEREFWDEIVDSVKQKKVDTWDYQFALCNIYNGSLSVMPNVNLVRNIGFGHEATHTQNADSQFALLATHSILPVHHPGLVVRDAKADKYYFDKYNKLGLLCNIRKKITQLIKGIKQ